MRDRNHAVRRSVQKIWGAWGGRSCCAARARTLGVKLLPCMRTYKHMQHHDDALTS